MSHCSVTGCERPAKSRTWCGTHYARWARIGSVELPVRIPPTCAADGCEARVYSNGWCGLHYSRMRHAGRLHLSPTPTVLDRLLAGHVVDEAGCWIWQGAPGLNGYGRMSVGDVLQYVHRLSYAQHVGPIPDGLTIDHLCRVRLCINPAHLEPVTREENTRRELVVRHRQAVAG